MAHSRKRRLPATHLAAVCRIQRHSRGRGGMPNQCPDMLAADSAVDAHVLAAGGEEELAIVRKAQWAPSDDATTKSHDSITYMRNLLVARRARSENEGRVCVFARDA